MQLITFNNLKCQLRARGKIMLKDEAILVSINMNDYPDNWIDDLLENCAKYEKRLNRAFPRMPVFLYDTEDGGIQWIAEVQEICEDGTIFGNAYQCELITKKVIQKIPIFIHILSYLDSFQHESLKKFVQKYDCFGTYEEEDEECQNCIEAEKCKMKKSYN